MEIPKGPWAYLGFLIATIALGWAIGYFTTNPTLENLSYLAQILIAIGALIALSQISILKEQGKLLLDQYTLSQEDVDYRKKQEAVRLALEQVEKFRKEILEDKNKKLSDWRARNALLQLRPHSLIEFCREEIAEGTQELKDKHTANRQANSDISTLTQVSELLNALEVFAIPFALKYADNEIGLYATGRTFCNIVDMHFDMFATIRSRGKKVNFYERTVQLYLIWSKELKDQENLKVSVADSISLADTPNLQVA
jgi:hypothetical protein